MDVEDVTEMREDAEQECRSPNTILEPGSLGNPTTLHVERLACRDVSSTGTD